MRATPPTLTYNDLVIYDGATSIAVSGLSIWSLGTNVQLVLAAVAGATQFRPGELYGNSAASFIAFDARL